MEIDGGSSVELILRPPCRSTMSTSVRKSDSHDELSGSHNGIRTRRLEACTAAIAFGMIPNIAGAIATSPVLINCLVGLFGNMHGGSFTEAQVQTVLLTDAVTNACTWAVAFHTALALKEGLDPADVQAIR